MITWLLIVMAATAAAMTPLVLKVQRATMAATLHLILWLTRGMRA
jgi:hypothetical protein